MNPLGSLGTQCTINLIYNPFSSDEEESRTSQLGGLGKNARPKGEAFVHSISMLKMAGKKLTTLLMKAGKVQLRINNLKVDLAQGLYTPSFAPLLKDCIHQALHPRQSP